MAKETIVRALRGSAWRVMTVACALASASSAAVAAPKEKGKAAADVPGVPPADAQYTIACQVFTGLTHQSMARQAKQYWAQRSGLPNFYVVHEERQSTLFYGYYRSIDPDNPKDKKEGQRAQADRAKVDSLTTEVGDRPFRSCVFVELVQADPPAPPEWNLANAKGYWSLQVGVYKDSPDRKKAAVEAVKEARARGVEAYYYHGQSSSSVCIGAWPREAVRELEDETARSSDPTQPLLVSPVPIARGRQLKLKETGQALKQYAPTVEPQDPTLIKVMNDFPEQALNGEVQLKKAVGADGVERVSPTPSYLVKIKREEPSLAGGGGAPGAGDAGGAGRVELPSAFAPPQPTNKGGAGKLKSLGK